MVALTLALTAAAAIKLGPAGVAWWQNRQADSAFWADQRRLAPAAAALNTMAIPTDSHPCFQQVVNLGTLCLRGGGDVLPAAASIVRSLRAVGASGESHDCARLPKLGVLCVIQADVRGEHLGLDVGPDGATISTMKSPRGVLISGGLGDFASALALPRLAPRVSLPGDLG